MTILKGNEGIIEFFDNVYHHAKKFGGELLSVCASEAPFVSEPFQSAAKIHLDRMIKIKHTIQAKCIITESDQSYCSEYSEYRKLSKHYVDSVPYYVYGDNCAFFMFNALPYPKVFVIKSESLAKSFKLQFQSIWDKATPLNIVERSPNTVSNKTSRK